MKMQFDAIIIGTGQCGLALTARLSATGMRVAIIERKLFGGTCVNTGCIPTKTLVAGTYAAHLVCCAGRVRHHRGWPDQRRMKRVKALVLEGS
jgi:pyruvate/2-oxoglutarate dehydrogenase complex dihydrolipoamide dehydrogenase (E3) component